MSENLHIPVLLNEVAAYLITKKDGVYVDGTFGAGGYTKEILKRAPSGKVFAIDKDPSALENGSFFEPQMRSRLSLNQGSFAQMKEILASSGITQVDGIVLDLGVSSMQIDRAERGFSFKKDGPLDMRMSQEGMSAADVVNSMGEEELADIIYLYGEERFSRRVAKAIVDARRQEAITRTGQLAEIVRGALGRKCGTEKIDPATRTFQALRIYVNHELEDLEAVLKDAPSLLAPGGRFVVVTFHSLEDRIVKNSFRSLSAPAVHVNRYKKPADVGFIPKKALGILFENGKEGFSAAKKAAGETFTGSLTENREKVIYTLLTKKPVLPGLEETKRNRRAHSAKLRAVERRAA